MKWSAVPMMAVRALRRNTMRTLLTALGIIIGIGAVITMVGWARAPARGSRSRSTASARTSCWSFRAHARWAA